MLKLGEKTSTKT